MAIRYKVNVLDALKDAGFTTYRIRKEKLLHEMTLQALRDEKMVSWKVLDDICALLNCQPGDLIERVPEAEESL
ncbi:MAG: helix-turn-helix transcriptional regulator [Oscillospiraceae bacterium]|nr:helix-turn-helix transcriptional regulator [Oscillospiraceae bacterium]